VASTLGSVRRGLGTAAAVVAAFVAIVATGALVLPDASDDPRLVPAPAGEEPPDELAVDEVCRDARPSPAPPDIQTSAPRAPVDPGEVAQVGLRDRSGPVGRPVAAEVTDPDGARALRDARLDGTAWTYLDYPSDFPGAGTGRPGTYRVRWQDGTGAALACDGFVVGASP
jgi:hypothetical protein